MYAQYQNDSPTSEISNLWLVEFLCRTPSYKGLDVYDFIPLCSHFTCGLDPP